MRECKRVADVNARVKFSGFGLPEFVARPARVETRLAISTPSKQEPIASATSTGSSIAANVAVTDDGSVMTKWTRSPRTFGRRRAPQAAFARDTATLSRLRENKKPIERTRSSPLAVGCEEGPLVPETLHCPTVCRVVHSLVGPGSTGH